MGTEMKSRRCAGGGPRIPLGQKPRGMKRGSVGGDVSRFLDVAQKLLACPISLDHNGHRRGLVVLYQSMQIMAIVSAAVRATLYPNIQRSYPTIVEDSCNFTPASLQKAALLMPILPHKRVRARAHMYPRLCATSVSLGLHVHCFGG